MALHRGIQSAIFYYLSCAPYFEAQTRKKRKQEAKRDRAAREALEADLPNLYRHPSPSSTNPFWQAEIDLGPTPRSRGKRKQTQTEKQRGHGRPETASSDNSGIASTEDLPQRPSNDDRHDSRWNFKSYQREDEELWGSASFLERSSCGDSVRRPPTARTKDSTRSNFQTFRNPPINDLHPATVTRVQSREEVLWMMQPPPVAEVMSGKQRAYGSRSNSVASRPNSNHPSLRKQNSGRHDPQRLKSFSSTSLAVSRDNSTRKTSNDASGQRHDRSLDISERDFAESVTPQLSQPSPLPVPEDPFDHSDAVAQEPPPQEQTLHVPVQRFASRPNLPTITSQNEVSTTDSENHTPAGTPNHILSSPRPRSGHDSDPRNHITQRSAILVHDKSLKIVQDLHPGSRGVLNTKIVSTAPSTHVHSLQRHSPVESVIDDSAATSAVSARPDMFESWETPDFKLPDWVHEYTRRDVQQRWSMDF